MKNDEILNVRERLELLYAFEGNSRSTIDVQERRGIQLGLKPVHRAVRQMCFLSTVEPDVSLSVGMLASLNFLKVPAVVADTAKAAA